MKASDRTAGTSSGNRQGTADCERTAALLDAGAEWHEPSSAPLNRTSQIEIICCYAVLSFVYRLHLEGCGSLHRSCAVCICFVDGRNTTYSRNRRSFFMSMVADPLCLVGLSWRSLRSKRRRFQVANTLDCSTLGITRRRLRLVLVEQIWIFEDLVQNRLKKRSELCHTSCPIDGRRCRNG